MLSVLQNEASVCTCGSNYTSWNTKRSLKFWQKFQDEYGMCSAKYIQNLSAESGHIPLYTIPWR